ncbi:hypothetical protein ACIQ4I_15345 [Rummeliibacillus sp. NPDC094406]|uniref:hypothetical protein n=1 Tax=Rummeliibacillus sp. NPDC094406 TaxID=3364511 RepID=UPI003826522E
MSEKVNEELDDEKYNNYKSYSTCIVKSRGLKRDSDEIDRVIRVHSEDGYILHSIVPRISEGETEGYILTFDSTNVD